MPRLDLELLRRHRVILALTALQALCALYFIVDELGEVAEARADPIHPLVEVALGIALLIGAALGALELRRLLRQNDRMRSRARAASGAFVDLMEEAFARWGLTPSERDVALLSMKGLPVAEIAALRRTQVGTVKAQSAAVYRKAGVNSRAELLAYFIDDLMGGVVLGRSPERTAPEAEPAGAAPKHGDKSRSDVALQHSPQ